MAAADTNSTLRNVSGFVEKAKVADDSSKTLVVIEDPNPTLRIKLVKSAKEAADRKPTDPGFVEKVKKFTQGLFVKAESELDLEPEATKEAKERNRKKLLAIFNKMEKKLDDQKMETLKKFDQLTPVEQEEVINFWDAVGDFFNNVFEWLRNMFDAVLDKIIQGYKVVKEALKGIFKTVYECLKMVF